MGYRQTVTTDQQDCPYQRTTVPGRGGDLTVGRWGKGPHIVVASHGITANHMSWGLVGQKLVDATDGEASLVAIDHRGRAGSAALPGPFGLDTHADDLLAVLDSLELDSAHLTGHSMGAFVVALAAERHTERVEQLVLVDGGLPFQIELPADMDTEQAVGAVIGPALARLDQRFQTEDDYVDFFVQHPAFQPPANQWWPAAEAYVRYDAVTVTTDGGHIRSSVNKDAVIADGGAAITDPESSSAIERITNPSTLLWSPRGLLDQTPGLYPQTQITETAARLNHLHPHLVEDTNHYTILVGDQGADAVVAALAAMLFNEPLV